MEMTTFIKNFWADVAKQDKQALRKYFHPNAVICWHGSNEKFNVEDYLIANCEYPGNWKGQVERIGVMENGQVISITFISSADLNFSCYVTSFFEIANEKILSLNEYYADCTEVPKWRKEMKLGTQIK